MILKIARAIFVVLYVFGGIFVYINRNDMNPEHGKIYGAIGGSMLILFFCGIIFWCAVGVLKDIFTIGKFLYKKYY